MAYAKDSVVGTAEEEMVAMSREWTSKKKLRQHWEYVVNPVPVLPEARLWNGVVRDEGHEGWSLEDFLSRCPQRARAAGLCVVHVAALRLYTGPGYTAINTDLREMAAAFKVTVRMCLSAITLLSKAASEKEGNSSGPPKLFFRGLGGAMEQRFVDFYRSLEAPATTDEEKALVWDHALCDLAMMSTTTDASVAAESFGGNIIFAITPSHHSSGLRCGAEVGWLSQYPKEAEWLFPCGTMLYPVPRPKRLPSLPFTPPSGKLVLQLYAFALELKPHPGASHALCLADNEEEAAKAFTSVRVYLKHNLSSTVALGLVSVLVTTAQHTSELDGTGIVTIFSSLAGLSSSDGSYGVVLPGAVIDLLNRFTPCVSKALGMNRASPASRLKNCIIYSLLRLVSPAIASCFDAANKDAGNRLKDSIRLYLRMWRALPRDQGLNLEAFKATWTTMHEAILAQQAEEMARVCMGCCCLFC